MFETRPATRDVGAIARGDTTFLREAVWRIAQARGWREDWLNDSVKGFLSARHSGPEVMRSFRAYPKEGKAGLRVLIAPPEYLLAMKCLAMRIGSPRSRDVDDIRMLVGHPGLTAASEVLDIVADYYPNRLIPPRTHFGVEEIMQTLNDGNKNE